jgi:hypothetical protein
VQDALLVIPPLRLSEALLYYYTILDPGLPVLSFLPIYPTDIIVRHLFVFFFLINQSHPLSLSIQLSLSTTLPKPQHTVNMRYQLIALPALAATVAAQDL